MDGPNETTPVQIAIKKEPQEEESQETAKDIGLKDYAETTMNEMLGWYGYDKVEIHDTHSLDLNQFTSSISEDKADVNNENISVGLHVVVNENSNDSNDRADQRSKLPNGHALTANNPQDYITCAWCQKIGLKLFTLCSSNGAKAFCSELCFSQCRRASFKKYKVCDWCKHIRHTVNYVDFKEGEQQLQFCSDKCLNQYKMNIFCKETEAHLQMHPLLPQDKGTFEGSTSNSSPSSSCANGSESASTLITPELWLQNCREPDSILPHGDEDGYGSDNDSNPSIFLGPDKGLAGPAWHYRHKPENLRTYSRLREKRHTVSNRSDASKPPCSPWLQQYYHRRSHRIEGKRSNDTYFKAGNCVRRSKRCISKADNCKDDATQAYKKAACAKSTRLVVELNTPSSSLLTVQSATTNALPHLTPQKVQPRPIHQVQPPPPHQVQPQQPVQLTSTGPHFNLREPSSMFSPSRPHFMFPHGMQLPLPLGLPQTTNMGPSAQQRLAMPSINPPQPKYMPAPPSGAQSNFFQQIPYGSILPPVTVMVPYPVFLPIPIPIPIPIPFPIGCKCKSNEGTNVGTERFPNNFDRNASDCNANANKDSDSQESQSSEQKMTPNENVLTRLQESQINEDQPNEKMSMKTAGTSLDLNISSFEEKHFSDISTHTLEDSTARAKMEPVPD